MCRLAQPYDQLSQRPPHTVEICGLVQCVFGHHLASLHCLQERIVKFLREARAFGQPLVEPCANGARHLSHSNPVHGPHDETACENTNSREQVSLVPCGCDRESDVRTFIIPNTIVVAGDDTKNVGAWSKVCVERLTARPGLMPGVVPSV